MSVYQLVQGLYLYPTPAGAYHAVSSREKDKSRQFLRNLLQLSETPDSSVDSIRQLSGVDNLEKSQELLFHCQKMGLVQGLSIQKQAPTGPLAELLPDWLGKISETNKVLMADHQGFNLASIGIVHEVAEELSALCAEIATVHERRSGLINHNLGIDSHAWAVVNAGGDSQLGFWPLFIGESRFVVAIFGIPHFNQPEFVDLVWAISLRYAANRR